MEKCIQETSIGDKKIFIFEHHHHALIPWASIKREKPDEEFWLFSMDHHTDIIEPFTHYCYYNSSVAKQELMADLDYLNPDSIVSALPKLRNDEQIRTALQMGIFKKALILSHDSSSDMPQSVQETERLAKWSSHDREYMRSVAEGDYQITPSAQRDYEPADICIPPFQSEGECECEDDFDNKVLEDTFLKEKLMVLSRMCKGVISEKGILAKHYILDIDLDYFHTLEALAPKSCEIFINLVRNAEAITIAEEPVCVEMHRSDGKATSQLLKEKLLELLTDIIRQ